MSSFVFKDSKVDFSEFYADETISVEDKRAKVIHHVRQSTWDNPELEHILVRVEKAEDSLKLDFLVREIEDLAEWDKVWVNFNRHQSWSENL